MITTLPAAAARKTGQLRPLNLFRDLPAVADLIELCFSSTLDPDGRSYIDQMRRNGQDANFLNWAPRVIETVSLPLSGFVWEDHGRVVGNVSLIPFSKAGKKIYLIANVATHPEYRRRGIARQLTAAALQRAREKHAQAIWLHVRDDNPGAIQLYRELGFIERARRTNWLAASGTTPLGRIGATPLQVIPRHTRDWPLQREWLARAYPRELEWYHAQSWGSFQPGLLQSLYRFLSDTSLLQWSVNAQGQTLGVLTCQRSGGYTERLWAALPAKPNPDAVTVLLLHGRRLLSQARTLTLEYPTGPADEAIRAAGLTAQRTLCWMEAPGDGLQPRTF